jgi:hypothetical protein
LNAKIEPPTLLAQPVRANQSTFSRLRFIWRADFLSPQDLVRRALIIAVIYGVVSAFGLREFTTILNGTMGSVALGWRMSAFLGLLYIFCYLAFVLITPSMLIAAGILFLWKRVLK